MNAAAIGYDQTQAIYREALAALPRPRRVDQTDDYHGVSVADPYRWMEDLADPELAPWVAAQERVAQEILGSFPQRAGLRERLAELFRAPVRGTPRMHGGRWFQQRNSGGQEQPAVCVSDGPEGEGRILIDPADLAADEIVTDVEPSPDGRLLLWATSAGGSDWKTWRVTDVDSLERPDTEVEDAKLWSAWLPDSSGYVYFGFSEGEGQHRATSVPQLRLHRLGQPPASDTTIFEEPDSPRYFTVCFTDDGRYCILSFVASAAGEIKYSPVGEPWDFRTLATASSEMVCIGGEGDTILAATTTSAPNGRVVAIRRDQPDPVHWRDVVPEGELPLSLYVHAARVGDSVLAVREQLGRAAATMHPIDGGAGYEVSLPDPVAFVPGDVSEPVGASEDGGSVCFTVSSPTTPTRLLRHDLSARTTEVVWESEAAPGLETVSEVVWATSADGTQVPMTITRRDNADPQAPVVIQGYGGGGSSMQPYAFTPWKVAWLEQGGVVVSAHLRGGSELGAEWRKAAERGGKLLAMQDFIACAEALMQRGVPSERIGITGASSGAMLAAAAVVARPDHFGACVAEVGLFDPLRYHLFGLGSLMIPEYGTSDDPEDFKAMMAYSPLHNLRDGVRYPPFLVTVHTDDDRVAPGTAYKFLAAIQQTQGGDAPVLLRQRAGAGHFGGTTSGEIEERADILSFLMMTLMQGGKGN